MADLRTHAPQHVKLSWSGVFGSAAAPVDIWLFGLSFGYGGGVYGVAELASFAGEARGLWGTHVAPKVSPATLLTRARAALVGGDGLVQRTAAGAYTQGDALGTTAGSGTPAMANGIYQVSLAVTTASVTPGPTGRGRWFLPGPAGSVDSTTGLVSLASAQATVDAMALFLNQLNVAAVTYGIGKAVVASGGSVVNGIPARLNPIVSLRVGRRPDVIRSRANAVEEGYTTALVT